MHVSPKENFYSDVYSVLLKTSGRAAALQPCSTYRRTAAIFVWYRNGSFLNAEARIREYQDRTSRGSGKIWRIRGGVYSDYRIFGLWHLAFLSVGTRSKLPTYATLKVNRFYRKFVWMVVIHFHNRKTEDSPVRPGRKGIQGRVR